MTVNSQIITKGSVYCFFTPIVNYLVQ